MPDYRPGITPSATRRLVVSDLFASGLTDSNAVVYMRESLFMNAADTVVEAAEKPEAALRFEQAQDPVVTIAQWLPVTEQMLEDVATLRSYISARLVLGVQLTEDKLLNGPGSGDIEGILNRDGLRAAEAGGTGALQNAEAILRAINGVQVDTGLQVDGVVIHSQRGGRVAHGPSFSTTEYAPYAAKGHRDGWPSHTSRLIGATACADASDARPSRRDRSRVA